MFIYINIKQQTVCTVIKKEFLMGFFHNQRNIKKVR